MARCVTENRSRRATLVTGLRSRKVRLMTDDLHYPDELGHLPSRISESWYRAARRGAGPTRDEANVAQVAVSRGCRRESMTSASPATDVKSDKRRRDRLLDRSASSHRVSVLAALCVVAAISYGSSVSGGRFSGDDWANAASTRFGGPGGTGTLDRFWQAHVVRRSWSSTSPRSYGLRTRPAAHVVWSLVLAVAAAFALYFVLRLYQLPPPLVAALPAALVIPFPFADPSGSGQPQAASVS